jgi:hypothetical protein
MAVAISAMGGAQQAAGPEDFARTVERCLAANTRSEFESLADVAARVSATCNGESGTVRLQGRGHPSFGDLLRYDPEGRRIVWQAPLTMSNRFGGTYSPYDYNPVLSDRSIPRDARDELRAAWDRNYWLIPVSEVGVKEDSYTARNGFGVQAQVQRRQSIRYGLAARIPPRLTSMTALLIPMQPERARGLIDRLDIVLSWRIAPGCRICLRANTKVTGIAPSLTRPVEERIENRYVFAEITRIQVVDRTTGEVIQDAVPTAP